MFTINPSESEQKHLLSLVSPEKEIDSVKDLIELEKYQYDSLLKSYTKNIMELYAENFNKGLKGKDLFYVAKIEHERSHKFFSKEVKDNDLITDRINNLVVKRLKAQKNIKESKTEIALLKAKKELVNIEHEIAQEKSKYHTTDKEPLRDDKKNLITRGKQKIGLNTHVHVVVHRNTKDYVKISPHAKSRGHSQKNQKGHDITVGFNHERFKVNSNEMFKEQFKYKGKEIEAYKPRILTQSIKNMTKNQIKSHTIGKVQNDLKKDMIDSELLKIKKDFNKSKEAIMLLAKASNPKSLMLEISKKIVGKTINQLR